METGKEAQIAYYEKLLAEHGPTCRALDWNSAESQKQRYQVIKEIFIYGKKSVNLSVLDVGCGLGDLYGFFKSEGALARHKIHYTGSDISQKILEAAKKKYPEAEFQLKDILEEKKLPAFDYVFCSGIFNIRVLDAQSHMEWVRAMLERMWGMAKAGMAVNFLSEGALPIADPEDLNSGRYFFFKPEEIINLVRGICGKYILRHDYHPGDFTVYLLK